MCSGECAANALTDSAPRPAVPVDVRILVYYSLRDALPPVTMTTLPANDGISLAGSKATHVSIAMLLMCSNTQSCGTMNETPYEVRYIKTTVCSQTALDARRMVLYLRAFSERSSA